MELDVEQMRSVTAFATLAPSVHNTQPWRFVANGHSLEVRADTGRMLTFLDPSSRQLHISCGAAVEFARLAVRSLGYDCVVRLVPRRDEPTLLATLTVGHLSPPTAAEQRLVDAVPRRYTDRGPYADRPVPPAVLAAAREAAAERGCWIRALDRPGDRVVAATLLARAEAAEAADPRYADELEAWRRESPAPDGVPAAATPTWDASRVTDVPLRDFTGHDRHLHPGGDAVPSVERDALLLVGSDDDSRIAWLRTGRALALILLTLTDAGISTQPLGPVTDVPLTRVSLRRDLGLLGHPQLLLRVGYGRGEPQTHRRAVDDVLSVTP